MGMKLLLLSNSSMFGQGYLDHVAAALKAHFSKCRRIAFVPFALHDHQGYGKQVAEKLSGFNLEVETVERNPSGKQAIERAEGIFVGGGNTFRLLDGLRSTGILEVIRQRAGSGIPYMGSSAGTVIAAPTIKTTNDMPIVQPQSFDSLGLVPFQINCHYLDASSGSTHMGETRETRLREFLEENSGPVLGLREGAWLSIEGGKAVLGGSSGARLFAREASPVEHATGDDLSFLLKD
jgi:dipeptidase E